MCLVAVSRRHAVFRFAVGLQALSLEFFVPQAFKLAIFFGVLKLRVRRLLRRLLRIVIRTRNRRNDHNRGVCMLGYSLNPTPHNNCAGVELRPLHTNGGYKRHISASFVVRRTIIAPPQRR